MAASPETSTPFGSSENARAKMREIRTELNGGKDPYEEWRENMRAARMQQTERMLDQAAIPRRFMDRSFDVFHATTPEMRHAKSVAVDYATGFERHHADGSGLVLLGKPGTGKSHLAAAILQHVIPAYQAAYVTCGDLIRAVRATWGNRGELSETQVLKRYASLDLLAIDEVGVQNGTDNEQHILFGILDARYRDMKPTIILSNLAPKGLEEVLGERAYDRLAEVSEVVQFNWPSHRRAA